MAGLLRLAVVAIAASTLAGCKEPPAPSNPEGAKRYAARSGIIEYKLSGMQNGTETLYWKDYGMREAKLTASEMSMIGVTRKIHRLELSNPQWAYSIDLETNSGTQAPNDAVESFAGHEDESDLARIGMELAHGAAGKKVGTAEIAGKTCDLYDIPAAATRTCIWQAIPLLVQVRMMGVSQEAVATRVDDGASIPDSRFVLPDGVRLEPAPDPRG